MAMQTCCFFFLWLAFLPRASPLDHTQSAQRITTVGGTWFAQGLHHQSWHHLACWTWMNRCRTFSEGKHKWWGNRSRIHQNGGYMKCLEIPLEIHGLAIPWFGDIFSNSHGEYIKTVGAFWRSLLAIPRFGDLFSNAHGSFAVCPHLSKALRHIVGPIANILMNLAWKKIHWVSSTLWPKAASCI